MLNSLKQSSAKTLGLTLAASLVLTAAMPIAQAEAGHKKRWHRDHGYHDDYRPRKKHKRDSGSDALAAGIIGFAIGAILADQARPRDVYIEPQPIYQAPQPIYIQPQPVYREPIRRPYSDQINNDYNSYDEPRVIRYEDSVGASYEPWTPEWARWCNNKYRSFNQNTGTFRGYDGLDHFCVVK